MSSKEWTGSWVARTLGIEIETDVSRERTNDLVGVALRRNPKRAHLLVSRVLAKHVPVPAYDALAAGEQLGRAVRDVLVGEPSCVIGFAETATALGHCVAETVEAPYLHSTRRPGPSAFSFEESHSHATTHRMQPRDPAMLTWAGPMVLVDDEFTTGNTVLNTIRSLHTLYSRKQYVVAVLADFRDGESREVMVRTADELGARIDCVSLLNGSVSSVNSPERLAEILADAPLTAHVGTIDPSARIGVLRPTWPADIPIGGRHGIDVAEQKSLREAAVATANELRPLLGDATTVHVLGTEELMFLPVVLAECLAGHSEDDGPVVTVSSTTRSPVLAQDIDGYPIRHGFAFDSGVVTDRLRYAYNLEPGRFDTIVVVAEVGEVPDQLLAGLSHVAPSVILVEVPGG